MPEERAADRQNPPGHWEGVYTGRGVTEHPWFTDTIDADFVAALDRAGLRPEDGPALDIGSGPGTTSRELARRGYRVTALDVSPAAVGQAKQRAGEVAGQIRWVIGSFLDPAPGEEGLTDPEIGGPYAFAYDRGCFHVFNDEERARYLTRIARVIRPGGCLFLKTFSNKQEGVWGPRRYAPEEIRELFSPEFALEEFEDTTFPGAFETVPLGLLCVLVRQP